MITILEGWNARKTFTGIEELADDIEQNGLNEPLEGVLSADGKKFMLTDGERRYRAIKLLIDRASCAKDKVDFSEIEVIPVPRGLKPQDMIVRMLSSGVQKSIYKDVEIADGILRLKTDFSLTNEDIGKKMGKSRQWVDNMVKLAKQPDEIKEAVSTGKAKKTNVLHDVVGQDKSGLKHDKYVPIKEGPLTDVVAGLIKPSVTPGLPPSLIKDGSNVSKDDALAGVNFDKEQNEQEKQINIVSKYLNKIEGLGKGLNDQGQKDLEVYLKVIRDNVLLLKEFYGKRANKDTTFKSEPAPKKEETKEEKK